ncbi:putative RNA binding protein [Rosellinia necatrix]|uniref:Putative RNA binding protein n=1 Tax=Rosellinia necatrix TaxID=77044 RepID=A0A1W2TB03_ROSNE|nr:putative RNA binding protein [Rosellinia necatrix]
MDRSLDEIVAESQATKRGGRGRRGGGSGGGSSGGGGGGRQPRERDSYPRDGVRKSTRDDRRGLDSDWVHDKFEGFHSRDRARQPQRRRYPEPALDGRGTKIKVENLHYDLSESDLEGLFNKIGPVAKLELLYDRAGRSEGVAFVTYESRDDASDAIREFNGANAKGQPIHMTIMTSAPRRNPFDTATVPGRPLAERITRPRSLSPNDRGIDRYVPEGGRRSHSPRPRRRGRRAGIRREDRGENTGRATGRDGRPKKTQEELDAEMEDYFEKNKGPTAGAAATISTNDVQAQAIDDVDMIE